MSLNSNNQTANIPESPLETEKKKWRAMDSKLLTPDNPQFEQYKNQISIHAKSTLQRIELMQKDPNGADVVQESWGKLKELYLEAVEMRAKMYPQEARKKMQLRPGENIETVLMAPIDSLESAKELDPQAQTIVDEMKKMAANIGEDPSALVKEPKTKMRYWISIDANGVPNVNLKQVYADEAFLLAIDKNMLKTYPELKTVSEKLMKGLELLEAIDPMKTAVYRWTVENAPNKMDTRPLKFFGAVGGTLLSGLGLAYSLKNKTPISWPTYMWGGIAAYSLYGHMLDPKEKQAIETYQKFNEPTLRRAIARFTPTTYEDCLALPKEQIKAMREKLKSGQAITVADVGALTGDQNGALTKTFLDTRKSPPEALSSKEISRMLDLLEAPKNERAAIENIVKYG